MKRKILLCPTWTQQITPHTGDPKNGSEMGGVSLPFFGSPVCVFYQKTFELILNVRVTIGFYCFVEIVCVNMSRNIDNSSYCNSEGKMK